MTGQRSREGYWTWRSHHGWELWVHWSCALMAGCVAVVTDRWLDRTYPDSPPARRRFVATLAGLVTIASIALHEFGHLLAARRLGLDPVAMVVAPFAGGTTIPRSAPTPASEAAFVLAGPATSLATAAAAAATAGWLPDGPLRAVLGLTATANLVLTAANLAPSLPADGGVAVRALSWHVTGDRDRATHNVRAVSQAAGVALVALGLLIGRRRVRWAIMGIGLSSLLGGATGSRGTTDPFGVMANT